MDLDEEIKKAIKNVIDALRRRLLSAKFKSFIKKGKNQERDEHYKQALACVIEDHFYDMIILIEPDIHKQIELMRDEELNNYYFYAMYEVLIAHDAFDCSALKALVGITKKYVGESKTH